MQHLKKWNHNLKSCDTVTQQQKEKEDILKVVKEQMQIASQTTIVNFDGCSSAAVGEARGLSTFRIPRENHKQSRTDSWEKLPFKNEAKILIV